jgi:putative FmdB family regulatory protein
MPHYDYGCDACGHELEAFQKITDEPLTVCPKCGASKLVRRIGGRHVGLHFQGEGFYLTDYARPKGCGEGGCGQCATKES